MANITSGDVMTCVPVLLSTTIRESALVHVVFTINLLFPSHFEQATCSLRMKPSIININSEMIVSLSFVQKI